MGRGEKVASAVGLDNGLLLASVVWLNIVKKKKRERVLAKNHHCSCVVPTADALCWCALLKEFGVEVLCLRELKNCSKVLCLRELKNCSKH